MAHYTIQCGALLPILWCITYYLCRLGSIGGSISCYCTPQSPIYRKETLSFQSSQYIILYFVLSTFCKEVPPSKSIDVYICYSFLRHGLLSYCLFLLFLCYFLGLGCITKRLWLMDATLANIQCAKVVDWRKMKEDRLQQTIGSHALIPLQVCK